MTMRDDVIEVLKVFEGSSHWIEFKEATEKKIEAMKSLLLFELPEDSKAISIHTLWRQKVKFVEGVIEDFKDLAKVQGGDILFEQMNNDIKTILNNIYKAASEDFNLQNSEHDVIRNHINYLESLLNYPEKIMEIELKERETAEIMEPLDDLEAIQQDELD